MVPDDWWGGLRSGGGSYHFLSDSVANISGPGKRLSLRFDGQMFSALKSGEISMVSDIPSVRIAADHSAYGLAAQGSHILAGTLQPSIMALPRSADLGRRTKRTPTRGARHSCSRTTAPAANHQSVACHLPREQSVRLQLRIVPSSDMRQRTVSTL